MDAANTDATLWETLQRLASNPVYLYIAAGVLLLVCLFLCVCLFRRQPKKIVAYSTDNGQVMVSRGAIVELVQSACEQLNDVSKPRVKLVVKRSVTNLDVEIKLQSGARLRIIEDVLQGHLRLALSENLGIEHLGYINIIATGFKIGRIEKTSTSQQLDDLTGDSFADSIGALDGADKEEST